MSLNSIPSHPTLNVVPRETRDKLAAYVNLLIEWQVSVNLISEKTLPDIWIRHIADSLQLLDHIEDRSAPLADIGAGAGFPGLMLAIAGCSDAHLIESDTKKCTFLREAARITGVPVTIHHGRAEKISLPKISLATSRACGSLSELINIVYGWRQKDMVCLFHKGQSYTEELHEAGNWKFDCDVLPSRVEPSGVILRISNLGKRNA